MTADDWGRRGAENINIKWALVVRHALPISAPVPAWNLSTSESAAKTDLEPNFSPSSSPRPSLLKTKNEREKRGWKRLSGGGVGAQNKYRDYLFSFLAVVDESTARKCRRIFAVVAFRPRGDDRATAFLGTRWKFAASLSRRVSIKAEERNAFDRARHDRSMRIYIKPRYRIV